MSIAAATRTSLPMALKAAFGKNVKTDTAAHSVTRVSFVSATWLWTMALWFAGPTRKATWNVRFMRKPTAVVSKRMTVRPATI